jgi:hypothetical protein
MATKAEQFQARLSEIAADAEGLLAQLQEREWALAGVHFRAGMTAPQPWGGRRFVTAGPSAWACKAHVYAALTVLGSAFAHVLAEANPEACIDCDGAGLSPDFLRMVGSPLPTIRISPDWLTWGSGTVVKVACAARDHPTRPTGGSTPHGC